MLGLDEPKPGITEVFVACCGQAAPKLVAWWTPANFRGDLGGANRRFPMLQKSTFKYGRKKEISAYGGAANGIPRNSTRSPVRFP